MSVELTTANSETAILTRVVEPIMPDLSAEAAQVLLKFRFTAEDTDRMHELSLKAQHGTLSSEEEAELDRYRHVGHFIELLWSSARLALKRDGNGK